MVSDDDVGNVEKDSDYFARRDNENRSMNMTDIDGRSDNYLAEIRRVSALKPNDYQMFPDVKEDENYNRSRSRSPIEMAT